MILQFPPWRDDSELAMVRDWFFPKHAKQDVFAMALPGDMRQRAVDKVNLWLFKAGQLPAALVATASLTEALLHDQEGAENVSRSISDSAMQSIYAMAFARFVNGFVDRDVVRSHISTMASDDVEGDDSVSTAARGESSMYAHAATIGMPQKFVDLRHQVTHADIPNLSYLREMTLQALGWLWERWWEKNVKTSPYRALRRLEDRQRTVREARESRESMHLDPQAAAAGRDDGADVWMES